MDMHQWKLDMAHTSVLAKVIWTIQVATLLLTFRKRPRKSLCEIKYFECSFTGFDSDCILIFLLWEKALYEIFSLTKLICQV